MSQITLDPKALAKTTLLEIESTLEKNDESNETGILNALQTHYATLEANQRLYINYLTEYIEKLKHTQHADKESLAQLKKQVLKHVLATEKKFQ